MQSALEMERAGNELLLAHHKVAGNHGDHEVSRTERRVFLWCAPGPSTAGECGLINASLSVTKPQFETTVKSRH